MDSLFAESAEELLIICREEAERLGCNYIGVEHLFLGLLRYDYYAVKQMLIPLEPNFKEIKSKIESVIKENKSSLSNLENAPLNFQAERIMHVAFMEQIKARKRLIYPEHILLAILFSNNSVVCDILSEYNYDYALAKRLRDMATQQYQDGGIEKVDFPTGNTEDSDFIDATMNDFSSMSLNNDETDDDDDEEDDDDDDEDDFYDDFDEDDDFAAFDGDPEDLIKVSNSGDGKVSALSVYGTDLTDDAMSGKLDPVIGRDEELDRMIQILCRRKKNNPIIVGESGVGKSALIDGLAIRIAEKRVPSNLLDKKIFSIDVTSIVAGTKYRGEFEKRMKLLINEVKKSGNIILFIDELQTMIGAGSAIGTMDASEIIKIPLAKGELQCIGTTTFDDYRQYIEKDVAFARRFQKVVVEPTSIGDTINILRLLKEKYEAHHNVVYTDEAVSACVKLTNRYVTDRFLPDKAIDAMDEAGAKIHISNSVAVPQEIIKSEKQLSDIIALKQKAAMDERFEDAEKYHTQEVELSRELAFLWKNFKETAKEHTAEVTSDHVAEVVSSMTGIPVNKISGNEKERLINIEQILMSKVIGQDDAIKRIARAIRRNRAGLKDPNKPIGSFIFMGQTGVGKTYLAKNLANLMFDSENALIRIDMGEFTEQHSVSKLIGAPPGYVGYEEGGQLTERVRRKPYSVVLLDEIEKAHPDIYNMLLQVLDYGIMTDGLGRKIDFKNTIIIMTSNIGSRQVNEFGGGVGFHARDVETKNEYAKSLIDKALKKTFSPEFLNRIDEIINFNVLTKDNMKSIIKLEIENISRRLKERGITIAVAENLIDHIIDTEIDLQYGARPIHRAIQKYVEDPVSEKIISDNIQQQNMEIIVDYKDGNVQIDTK